MTGWVKVTRAAVRPEEHETDSHKIVGHQAEEFNGGKLRDEGITLRWEPFMRWERDHDTSASRREPSFNRGVKGVQLDLIKRRHDTVREQRNGRLGRIVHGSKREAVDVEAREDGEEDGRRRGRPAELDRPSLVQGDGAGLTRKSASQILEKKRTTCAQ